jgi:hypothetical protein
VEETVVLEGSRLIVTIQPAIDDSTADDFSGRVGLADDARLASPLREFQGRKFLEGCNPIDTLQNPSRPPWVTPGCAGRNPRGNVQG